MVTQFHEKNILVAEKECSAVLWAIQTLRSYMQRTIFPVYSDRACLQWLLEIGKTNGRLMRRRTQLTEFDFDVMYRNGLLTTQADAFSRLRSLGETLVPVDADVPTYPLQNDVSPKNHDGKDQPDVYPSLTTDTSRSFVPVTTDKICLSQSDDDFCRPIRATLDAGERVPFALDIENVLFRSVDSFKQVVLPQSVVPRVVHLTHHARIAGHPDGRQLYKFLCRSFFRPDLSVG